MVVNGATSEPITIISGVPQGSVLGPLLFLVYVNSLCDLTLSNSSQLVLYADNLVLYKATQSEEDYLDYQSDITNGSMNI